MSTEEKLADYLSSTTYDDLPPEVTLASKKSIMDTLGVSLAGSSASGVKEIASLVKEWGGKPESTVFLYQAMVPAHEAALVNATMARALDFDDVHMKTATHANATVVPAALAVAELCGKVNGKEFITAITLGAELMYRMRSVPDFCSAVSGWVGELYGGFGAAAAAGKIMGLTLEEMGHALGLACSQAAGVSQPFYDGALATRVQQGLAARSGITAALLARKGITGANNFLEGKAGFYPVYYRGINYDINRLTDGLGQRYELLNVATKLYPCCGFTHAAIGNVLDIIEENQLSSGDISKVLLRVNQRTYTFVCTPTKTKYRPQTVVDAMFSLPYTVGTVLFRGDVSLEDFSPEAISDTERLKAIDKVEVVADEDIDRESIELNLPLSLHIAELRTKGGQCFAQKVLYAKGYPERPVSINDCTEKVRRCAPFAVKPFPQSKVNQLIEIVENLEQQEDVNYLAKLLS